MAGRTQHSEAWRLAGRQQRVVSREQLLGLCFTRHAIQHRLERGRLHPLQWPGVYAVGHPDVGQLGRWMAAALVCGPGAVLSHASAAALWKLIDPLGGDIHISLTAGGDRRHQGIRVHRRPGLAPHEITEREGIPVTVPATTLIDVAPIVSAALLERAVNEADKLELIDPPRLRRVLDAVPPRPGVAILRRVLDRRTFVLTRSELERRFLPLAKAAGLPKPETQVRVNGFVVDFFWPQLGLVVETDGLRYHRTPAQQARDRLRDQAHTAAGLTPLRFTHGQVRYEPRHVRFVLAAVARRLS